MTRKLRNAATPPSDADSALARPGPHTGPSGTAVANGVGAAEEDDSQPAGELIVASMSTALETACTQEVCGH